jgi:hypothetical protein
VAADQVEKFWDTGGPENSEWPLTGSKILGHRRPGELRVAADRVEKFWDTGGPENSELFDGDEAMVTPAKIGVHRDRSQ